jgi:hypothetical protein
MSVTAALKKVQAGRIPAASELPSPWKSRRKRARTRRLLWIAGLVAGVGIAFALIWGFLCRED